MFDKPWCFWSNWVDEKEEDVRSSHDKLEGEPVMVYISDEDGVQEPNAKWNLSKGGHKGSLLRTGPLKEDSEANNVGANTAGSDHHV